MLATFSPPSVIYKHSSYIDPPNAQHFLDWKGHGEAVENAAGRGFLKVVEDFDKMEGRKTHYELFLKQCSFMGLQVFPESLF